MALSKKKQYARTKFSPEVLREALGRIGPRDKMKSVSLDVEDERDVAWSFDDDEEFFAAYRSTSTVSADFVYQELGGFSNLSVNFYANVTRIRVRKTTRSGIERVFEVFEASAQASLLPPDETAEVLKKSLNIFVGHGRDPAWRDLKDHLHDKHGFNVTAYETGPRVGLHIADVLEMMEDEAPFDELTFQLR